MYNLVRHISHVAIKTAKNKIISLPKPFRHHHLIHHLHGTPDETKDLDCQGFTDNCGRWLTREKAVVIAREAKQIIKKTGPDYELFSEDVWLGPADETLIPSLIKVEQLEEYEIRYSKNDIQYPIIPSTLKLIDTSNHLSLLLSKGMKNE